MIRSQLNFKLFFLFKILLIYLIICLKSYAADPAMKNHLVVVGPDDAAVKIKVFSSLVHTTIQSTSCLETRPDICG